MNLLFIMSASIAITKSKDILNSLKKKNVTVNCILTNNAMKMIDKKEIKKCIKGKLYYDSLESKKKCYILN